MSKTYSKQTVHSAFGVLHSAFGASQNTPADQIINGGDVQGKDHEKNEKFFMHWKVETAY